MRQTLTVIIAAMITASVCFGAEADLEKLKDIFDEQRLALSLQQSDSKKLLSNQYVAALDAAIETLIKTGDPTPVVEARRIRDFASHTGKLPDRVKRDAPELIQKVQSVYVAQSEKLLAAHADQRAVLVEQYRGALERAMKDLTTAGEIERAVAVKRKIEQADEYLEEHGQTADKTPVAKPDPETPAAAAPEAVVRTIPLVGTKSSPQWQKQLFTIPAGSFVKVTATPKDHLSKGDMEHRCFAVKFGKLGQEKWFNTAGRHNTRVKADKGKREWVWRIHPAAEFEASQDDSLYIMQTGDRAFTVNVEVFSEKPNAPAPSRRKRRSVRN